MDMDVGGALLGDGRFPFGLAAIGVIAVVRMVRSVGSDTRGLRTAGPESREVAALTMPEALDQTT